MSTPDNKPTITVYAYVNYTDATGTHAEGETITLPYETDAEKAEVQGMISYGIVGTERKSRQRSAK